MKRAIVVAISVILALVVAAPIASGQSSSQGKNLGKGQNLGKLTGDWWNWAFSTNPSPVNGGDPCGGNFVDGVFFLAGSFASDAGDAHLHRTGQYAYFVPCRKHCMRRGPHNRSGWRR